MGTNQPTIMVVEDEKLLLEAIEMKLKQRNITSLPYESGKVALEYLQSSTQLPDMIWLDYFLKDMDGLEFMQEIKKSDKLSKIPVIVVSNSASATKVKTMMDLGVKTYLLKAQYDLDEIIDTVHKMLKGEHVPSSSEIEFKTND